MLESKIKIHNLEHAVKEAKQEVTAIKSERRDNEGKIMFLKYQLDKLKSVHNRIANEERFVHSRKS
jgi:DNA repair ATPase RecN